MFSSLLRPKQRNRRVDSPGFAAPPTPGPAFRKQLPKRRPTADFTEAEDDDEDTQEDALGPFEDEDDDEDEDEDEEDDEEGNNVNDEDNMRPSLPVLPLFSASYLDSLPIYNITHAIRVIVQTRTETTLTWEQLRSPQVSQFLVKPMQQQIRTQHFSRATLYALMANCLQFQKEGQLFPGNAGVSATRARACEVLALKLLKEYNTRELIDALSYDFYPLQGLPGATAMAGQFKVEGKKQAGATAARTSTLEVAIRASAKHLLAHPLVVQQLEAIWNGAVTFYSSADTLHRGPPSTPVYPVSASNGKPDVRTPLLGGQPRKEGALPSPAGRRTVILYDPRQASLFKLSRLRVPRYRFFVSTLSLLVLIGLFLAVLIQRSSTITPLELIFWFWSAGFMLDELVGFNEQGFSLYIMSFWNIFDLGILVLLIIYYVMRVYGVFLIDPKHWNDLAYDVLAANAILLLPRIFSVLDHYQYFSQLLIAFRLMAIDLAAVCFLICICCSGFFVFFTLANNNNDAADVAYKIFQILMGFTPAAWDAWPTYGIMERFLLALFLIMCHFVVVTILITVLTNSFMKIASNATEEHQFLFALNTISMVKNDALFSYVAPGNIFAWLLMPLRYCIPLQHFVLLNRLIIKATHFPILFCIYVYERYWLASSMYEPTDLVEHPGRARGRALSLMDPSSRAALFSPNVRVREEFGMGFQKDHALEEVFRTGPGMATLRSQRRHERRKTQNAIRNWMDQHDEDGSAHNPQEWPTLNSQGPRPDWHRRLNMGRDLRANRSRQFSDIRSAASDPADLMSQTNVPLGSFSQRSNPDLKIKEELKDQTDADGDDELLTNDEEEEEATNAGDDSRHDRGPSQNQGEDYFTTPMTARFAPPPPTQETTVKKGTVSPRQGNVRRGMHSRTLSTNTILYAPQEARRERERAESTSSISPAEQTPVRSRPLSRRASVVGTPVAPPTPVAVPKATAPASRQRSPRRQQVYVAGSEKPRPIAPPRTAVQTAPSRAAHIPIEQPAARQQKIYQQAHGQQRPGGARRLSSADLSAMSDNTNLVAPADPTGGMPSSFQTQMAMALMRDARFGGHGRPDPADRDRMGRLVLARMKTLEESFADVARELRELKSNTSSSTAPATRRNSSDEDLHGLPMIEIAGRDRRRAGAGGSGGSGGNARVNSDEAKGQGQCPGPDPVSTRPRLPKRHSAKRPISRRSMKETKVGMGPPSAAKEKEKEKEKGKGKEVMPGSSESENERGSGGDDFSRKGSSF